MDPQPRPRVRPKKRRRDRLIRWAQAHPDWILGFEDEVWWSRLARPPLRAWAEPGCPVRLVEQTVAPDDPDPKALAGYGLYLPAGDEVWLRFVAGRPVSARTTEFLAWCAERLAACGARALLLVWDNAGWHVSAAVRAWLHAHNRHVKREGGVRILSCFLPSKSPWLNPIEPKWRHAKPRVVEPDRLLSAAELEQRVCAALGSPPEPHLPLAKEVA